MTLRVCGFCGRDLPAGAHHLLRYCPDRDCQRKQNKQAEKRRRKAPKAEPGTVRKVGRRRLVLVPDGHPLRSPSGWASTRRVELHDRLGGADPRCACCGHQLSWRAPGDDPARVCAMNPPGTEETVALCRRCLTGVGIAGGCLRRPLHPLAWAEACDSYNPPVEDRGGCKGAGAAAHGLKVDARLAALWDGSESHADQMTVTATLLALRARRMVAV